MPQTEQRLPPPAAALPAAEERDQPFRAVLLQIQNNSEHLPSLPITCDRVRRKLSNPNATVLDLAQIISKDPALSALIIKTGTSPIYYTGNNKPSLEQIISLLGYPTINNLVMLHSIRSLFFSQDKRLKPLCNFTWRSLALKAGLATVIAKKLDYARHDDAMLAALYSELGSLAILSALGKCKKVPNLKQFHLMCHSYTNYLSGVILRKWQADAGYLEVVRCLGKWHLPTGIHVSLCDIVNLAHYHAASLLANGSSLPRLEVLSAYKKLPKDLQKLNDKGLLLEIMKDRSHVAQAANSFL